MYAEWTVPGMNGNGEEWSRRWFNIPEAIAAAAKTAERMRESFIFDARDIWRVVKVVGITVD